MGAACCVAAKDRTIVHGPSGGTLPRHVKHSPSWSFRWDNRVAGEETHGNWLHYAGVRNDQTEAKSGTNVEPAFASEEGSCSPESLRSHGKRSPVPDDDLGISKPQLADEVISKNLVEVKESAESPSISHPSPVKFFPGTNFASASPLTSQSRLNERNSSPSRCQRYFHGPYFHHGSQIQEFKPSPFSISEEAPSHLPSPSDRSSESWSIPIYSELMTTRRERRSFDSENSSFCMDKINISSWRSSDSPSLDPRTCGACANLLSERSSWAWSCQKIVSTNELAVVSILNCGHVYHAECLEHMTPEINMYDPPCPVCTYGEKALKMCEKSLKAELALKARHRSSSSNLIKKASSLGKPFLKRHFSFSSKSGKPLPDDHVTRRKGFFWSRSSKERARNYE